MFQIISDIHLEFDAAFDIDPQAPNLIIAGDFCTLEGKFAEVYENRFDVFLYQI